ncbi:MAG: baseplate J/gp47 family protein, partial [Fimbriimonadales bacterium]
GSDAESYAALLERLLAVLSQPAQGGNANDYRVWALSVPGVRRAFVFPLRRGLGTVDLVPMPEVGLPSSQLLDDVQAYIDALKPVGMGETGFLALAPTPVVVNVVGDLELEVGVSLAQVMPQIESGLARVFYDTDPGETLHLARIVATIVNVPGVRDVTLTSPTSNITPAVNSSVIEMVELGAINLS